MTSIQDDSTYESANPHEAQCFVYDGHNRLANAWTEATDGFTGTCDAFPSLPTTQTEWDASAWAASAGPYATTWDYSDSGRIESITNLIEDGLSGSTESVQAFEYDSDGNGTELSVNDLPHAVSGVDNDGDSTVDDTFEYDTAGRQTVRTVDGVTSTLTWDVSSNLVKAVVDDGTNETTWVYVYDASGQRITKIQLDGSTPVDATAYFGTTEVTDTDTSADGASDVTAVRYYAFGGATVALEQSTEHPTSPTVDLFYLFGDFQGSAQVMMSDARDVNGDADPANATILRNAYTPYGAQRSIDVDVDTNPDPNLPTERGWLSQITDEATDTAGTLGTGLTYLNARYYDPVTARFLSPDPLMNPQDPRTLDPYMYAANNPILFQDATGLCYGLIGQAMATCQQDKTAAWTTFTKAQVPTTPKYKDLPESAQQSMCANGEVTGHACNADVTSDDFDQSIGFSEGAAIVGNGFANLGAGVVDGVTGTLDLGVDIVANLGRPWCTGDVLGITNGTWGCVDVTDIAKIGVIGDPGVYGFVHAYGTVLGSTATLAGGGAAFGAARAGITGATATTVGGSSSIVSAAAAGRGMYSLGSATQAATHRAGAAWVGAGATWSSSGRALVAANRLRQYRPPNWKDNWGQWQANFESRGLPTGPWVNNGHMTVTNIPPVLP